MGPQRSLGANDWAGFAQKWLRLNSNTMMRLVLAQHAPTAQLTRDGALDSEPSSLHKSLSSENRLVLSVAISRPAKTEELGYLNDRISSGCKFCLESSGVGWCAEVRMRVGQDDVRLGQSRQRGRHARHRRARRDFLGADDCLSFQCRWQISDLAWQSDPRTQSMISSLRPLAWISFRRLARSFRRDCRAGLEGWGEPRWRLRALRSPTSSRRPH